MSKDYRWHPYAAAVAAGYARHFLEDLNIEMWKNRDEAFADVARGIREAAKNLAAGAPGSSAPASPSAGCRLRLLDGLQPRTGSPSCEP